MDFESSIQQQMCMQAYVCTYLYMYVCTYMYVQYTCIHVAIAK